MALPPSRSDSARTRWPPATTATSVVPPPMSTMNAPVPSVRPTRTRGRGDRFFDEPHRAPGLDRRGGRRQRPLLDPGGPAGDADHRRRPQQGTPQPCLAQERLQHGHRPVQVGDDPVPQRVDDVDAVRFLARQHVRGLPHGGPWPVARSTAIAEGSSTTSPRPGIFTSVFTVPRSTATPVRSRIMPACSLLDAAWPPGLVTYGYPIPAAPRINDRGPAVPVAERPGRSDLGA